VRVISKESTAIAATVNRVVNGVMNIGIRPTIASDIPQRTVEVHILDWHGDLYGYELTVELIKFLRPEQKFNSLELLQTQIQADCELALTLNP